MRILGSIFFVGFLGLAACGGSQKGETTPENPCTPAANPCNPDGTQDPNANPDAEKKEAPEGESNW
jgi:hypothetical protein